jgi:CheY-like chemotaxis protein
MQDARKRILCVEDDRETAALIAEELADLGYEVELAYDGHEALTAILRKPPDLVLSDISMPIMSGFELMDRLIGLTFKFSEMPVIFVTALADRDNELKARRLGVDDYVTKPIDFEILQTILAARLAGIARKAYWPQDADLTEREIEILTWVARGKTSAEISGILGLTKRTIDFHADNARTKLGMATRTGAAVKAVADRLIKK